MRKIILIGLLFYMCLSVPVMALSEEEPTSTTGGAAKRAFETLSANVGEISKANDEFFSLTTRRNAIIEFYSGKEKELVNEITSLKKDYNSLKSSIESAEDYKGFIKNLQKTEEFKNSFTDTLENLDKSTKSLQAGADELKTSISNNIDELEHIQKGLDDSITLRSDMTFKEILKKKRPGTDLLKLEVLPESGASNVTKGIAIINLGLYAYDVHNRLDSLMKDIAYGEADCKDYIMTGLSIGSLIPGVGLVYQAASIEETFELILGKKTIINENYSNAAQKVSELAEYVIGESMFDLLENKYYEQLENAKSADEVSEIISYAKNDHIELLVQLQETITDIRNNVRALEDENNPALNAVVYSLNNLESLITNYSREEVHNKGFESRYLEMAFTPRLNKLVNQSKEFYKKKYDELQQNVEEVSNVLNEMDDGSKVIKDAAITFENTSLEELVSLIDSETGNDYMGLIQQEHSQTIQPVSGDDETITEDDSKSDELSEDDSDEKKPTANSDVTQEKLEELEGKSREQLALKQQSNEINSKLSWNWQQKASYEDQLALLSNEKNELKDQLAEIESKLSEYQGKKTGLDKQEIIDKLENIRNGFVYAQYLKEKYNGDYNQLSYSEKFKLKKYSKIIYDNTYQTVYLFQNGYKHVKEAVDAYNQALSYQSENQAILAEITNLRAQQEELKNRISQIDAQMEILESSIAVLEPTIQALEEQGADMAEQISESQDYLSGLVSDVQDLEKQELAEEQAPSDNSETAPSYSGFLSALSTNGTLTGARPRSDTEPHVGMALTPIENNSGIFSGDYTIDTQSNSDSSGEYSYLSWGTWDETNPPQIYTENNGNVNTLAGGHWIMGELATDIPRQGSASYQGELIGDYKGFSSREAGVMTGSVSLNANFSNATITGSMNILRNNAQWANPTLQNSYLDAKHNAFGAELSGGYGGNVSGRFYGGKGTIPAEVGGDWWYLNNDGSAAVGIFRGKKQ
ncbi:hypothetical protein [Desulfobacter vibrioformis]|uniref:hypothetical protein n=1 Tax=Desulfobacter vibrioformis TaxID=34031 RepID=UPI00054E265D|nr:hypothetical protein [Desulfobacter vibrioformis]